MFAETVVGRLVRGMSVCPYAEPYGPRQDSEWSDPDNAVAKARAVRTETFWQAVFQKGRQCRLNRSFCNEYDLADWQSCPVLKRFQRE